MADTPDKWQFQTSELVLKGNAPSAETKMLIGAAMMGVGYWWARRQRFKGLLFAGPNLIPDLLTAAGGIVFGGGVTEMFWPPTRPVPAEFLKQFQFDDTKK